MSVSGFDPVENVLLGYVAGERKSWADRDLKRYRGEEPYGEEPFTGCQFERIATNDHPNVFTANDLVAVTMLGVDVPAKCTIWILGDGQSDLTTELEQIPSDIDIWDADDHHFAAASRLWDLLRKANWPSPDVGANGMGPAIKSKLLAAKRPRVLPIIDSVVFDALGRPPKFWGSVRHAMGHADSPVVTAASELDRGNLSVLRAVDVVVWMANRHPMPGDPPLPGAGNGEG